MSNDYRRDPEVIANLDDHHLGHYKEIFDGPMNAEKQR
jgi:hypothetical protein